MVSVGRRGGTKRRSIASTRRAARTKRPSEPFPLAPDQSLIDEISSHGVVHREIERSRRPLAAFDEEAEVVDRARRSGHGNVVDIRDIELRQMTAFVSDDAVILQPTVAGRSDFDDLLTAWK